MRYFFVLFVFCWIIVFLIGCTDDQLAAQAKIAQGKETAVKTAVFTVTSSPPATNTPTRQNTIIPQPPSLTPIPTEVTPTPPIPTQTPSPTPIGLCSSRMTSDDLLTIVTQTYNLSRHYAPQDLVLLTDYLPMDVTLGYPTEIREVARQPLISMISDMQAAGLNPQIISGYRSYAAQSIAWDKWNREEPERAAILSARPGHSEHQLGTVVDFGSPSLSEIVGQTDIEFHTYFFKTPEGIWLLENAHQYGFTLSYTREAAEITGFYYEPWHYRYVGIDRASELKELGLTLTEYQLNNQPEPCIPD